MNGPFLQQLINEATAPGRIEFHAFLDGVMQGRQATKHEVVAFLAGLSAKPLNATNIVNFVTYAQCISPPKLLPGSEDAVSIVGTGGGISTFNISTAVAFVASVAGAKVLKSGSRAYSSTCGSLDVLRTLNVPMPEDEAVLAEMVGELGIGFIAGSHYTPWLRHMAAMVLPLEFRDIAGFINTVGPLLCPFQTSGQLIGVSRPEHMTVFADAIRQLRRPRTLLVHAEIRMDELCSIGTSRCRLIDCDDRSFTVSGKQLGFADDAPRNWTGGAATENAVILREVLAGHRQGAARDTVVLNAAALLLVAGITPSIETGIQRCTDAIDEGRALWQLERVVDWGRRLTANSSP